MIVPTSPEGFQAVIDDLKEHQHFGYDTETSGLRWSDRLFSIILATADEVYYFNFQEYPGVTPLPRAWITRLQEIFTPEKTFYGSNAKFDMAMIRKEGVIPHGNFFCTTAQARVLQNNLFGARAYSLKSLSSRYLNENKLDMVEEYIAKHGLSHLEAIPGKLKRDKIKYYDKVPLEIMQEYAEMDARLHLKLGLFLEAEIEKLDNGENFKYHPRDVCKTEIAVTGVCHQMEWDGIKCDTQYIARAKIHEQAKAESAKARFYELTGGIEFRDSAKVLKQAFTECGYESIPTTAKGNPSFNSDALKDMGGELADCLRTIRHHEKRLGTYYSSFEYYADADGVIHPDMRQGGTETGRFSYSNPNLQNVPRENDPNDSKYDPDSIVRRSFVPRQGYCFVAIDYKQQEYRMMLDYAGEKDIIKLVNAGADLHQAMADVLGISRQQTKNVNFAKIYGAGPAKLAGMIGVTLSEARRIVTNFNRKFAKVDRFTQSVILKGKYRKYVINWAGRRCHIAQRDWAYILPNHLIQGGCADVVKRAMPLVYAMLAGTKSRMLLQVHDELLFEMHPDDFHLIASIRRVMENVYKSKNKVKLEVDVDHSWVSWGKPDLIKGEPTNEPNN